MSTWIIIPIKPMEHPKSRLASVLSQEQRVELSRTLLGNIIKAILTASQEVQIAVISPSKSILKHAQMLGAVTLSDPGSRGYNEVIAFAAAHAWKAQADRILILPYDLPFISADDIQLLLNTDHPVVICPNRRYEGTNALSLRNLPKFTFQYGEDSFSAHLREANRCGCVAKVLYSDNIEFDLDVPGDWLIYQHRTGKRETQHRLRERETL